VKNLNEDIPEDLMTLLLYGRAVGQAHGFISSRAAQARPIGLSLAFG
jgi:hypothetical protein